MSFREHIVLMASYNAWMNTKVYQAAASLSHAELMADRGAFFCSIFGTLNHVVVGDTIWLQRFAAHPANHRALDPVRAMSAPAALDEPRAAGLDALRLQRRALDDIIAQWAGALSDQDLEHLLAYRNTKGREFKRSFASLIMHFFNHQTHHRGQASTLLSQAGVGVGETDLLALIPDALVP